MANFNMKAFATQDFRSVTQDLLIELNSLAACGVLQKQMSESRCQMLDDI
jgi:hypothetical protein